MGTYGKKILGFRMVVQYYPVPNVKFNGKNLGKCPMEHEPSKIFFLSISPHL